MTQVLQIVTLPKILCRQELLVSYDNKYSEDDKVVKKTDSKLKNANVLRCTHIAHHGNH